ncbi:DUF3348 family protein [Litorivivens sp.]|uniref:DUF3348 family protein n=1 Tax=Litorivivens sp. TaxID=2020868 RepID=UPI0035691869
MSQAARAPDIRSQPPLLQKLASMNLLTSGSPASYNLAELLGAQINLSDSISLARALTSLETIKTSDSLSMERPQRQFLNARGGMIRFVLRSFEANETAIPFMLPQANQTTLDDPAEAIKPYQRFYSLHQSEMDHRVTTLRKSLRASLALDGPPRSKLANLDRILDDTLGEYGRKVLARLPKMLVARFALHREEFLNSATADQPIAPANWQHSGGWLHGFHQDIKQLLLAELDLRLLPARALLEALETQD